LRLLNQMTIELIVLERAKVLGIEISDAEVEQAVAEIKSDYPEGVFEETLLEFAVSFKTWVDRLRTRLIMEKVIDKELKDQIVITPEDVASYYEQNYKDQKPDSEISKNSNDINEAIIEILRRKKFNSYEEAKRGIEDYIHSYNYVRPHQGINGSFPSDRFHGINGETARIETELSSRSLDFSKGYLIFKNQEHTISVVGSSDGLQVFIDGTLLNGVNHVEC